MLSFWEWNRLEEKDFAIVGGGILGLFTALEISIKYPNAKIALYERDFFANGATSKNAGFACFGSITEIMADRKRWGDDKTQEIIHKRWEGIQRIQTLLGNKIDYENHGGYELFVENNMENEVLDNVNQFLHPIFNQKIFSYQSEKIREFGFGSQIKNISYNALEGQLHSGKLIQQMHVLLRSRNVELNFNSEITDFVDGEIAEFTINNKFQVKSNKLIFTTNAFPPLGVNEIKPGRGQVLITKPISNLKFKGCFHFEEGFYYFRNVGDRILFGGGRNLDFEGESDDRFLLNDKIQYDLIDKLNTLIAPNEKIEIEQQWSGIMAFSTDKLPMIKHLGQNVLYAMNCNGMGVSLSPVTAKEIAQIL